MVLGTSLCCSLTACQVHKTQLPGAHTPIGQIPALHRNANDEVGTGTFHIHFLGNIHHKKGILNGLWYTVACWCSSFLSNKPHRQPLVVNSTYFHHCLIFRSSFRLIDKCFCPWRFWKLCKMLITMSQSPRWRFQIACFVWKKNQKSQIIQFRII